MSDNVIKNKKIRDVLSFYKINDNGVFEYLDSIDDNTSILRNHVALTIINHTEKTGITVLVSNSYAGFYCFVNYCLRSIRIIKKQYSYKLKDIFTQDGFTSYKEQVDDDLRKIVFDYKDDVEFPLDKYFSMSNNTKLEYQRLCKEYSFNAVGDIGIYYRGTDKIAEMRLPNVENYFKIVDSMDVTKRIFVQTDQQQILDKFIERYGKRVYFIKELPLSNTTADTYHAAISNKIINAIRFHCSLVFLSSCNDLVITRRSNCSEFIKQIRENDKKVYNIT